MAQKQKEEQLDVPDHELGEMKMEIGNIQENVTRIPRIEEALASLARSIPFGNFEVFK